MRHVEGGEAGRGLLFGAARPSPPPSLPTPTAATAADRQRSLLQTLTAHQSCGAEARVGAGGEREGGDLRVRGSTEFREGSRPAAARERPPPPVACVHPPWRVTGTPSSGKELCIRSTSTLLPTTPTPAAARRLATVTPPSPPYPTSTHHGAFSFSAAASLRPTAVGLSGRGRAGGHVDCQSRSPGWRLLFVRPPHRHTSRWQPQ